jgi:aminodeoxyfutalosine synthase
VTGAGLGVWRFTVDRASLADRLALIDRVVDVQRETGAARAFAPLPRLDPVETPSTGYDDVKTIAAARLRCPASLVVQVDWPLYGPKLAQVALAYGAGDIDGVAAVDTLGLGHRRSPAEDIARQIRAAGGRAVERSGRFAPMG